MENIIESEDRTTLFRDEGSLVLSFHEFAETIAAALMSEPQLR